MNCMKCGREIDGDQVFCQECLFEMEKYPVKPGTSVQLPPRREQPSPKKTHTRYRGKMSLEEQVRYLRKQLWILSVILAVCLILLAVLAVPAFRHFRENHFLPGQNYSAVDASNSAGSK